MNEVPGGQYLTFGKIGLVLYISLHIKVQTKKVVVLLFNYLYVREIFTNHLPCTLLINMQIIICH